MNWKTRSLLFASVAFAGIVSPKNLPAQTVEAVQAVIPSKDLGVTVGRSIVVDSGLQIVRVSVANPDLVEAVAINPHEILINGKAPGQTSMIVWAENGKRSAFELNVSASTSHLEAVRVQLAHEFPGQNIDVDLESDTVFLRGTAKDLTTAQRAVTIASTLGKVINLMRVDVPAMEPQILLKVRFADIDRTASDQFGVNLFSTGATNTIGSTSTGQFPQPTVTGAAAQGPANGKFSLSQALNIFLFRNDLNLGATIQDLQTKGLLQILAEPNLLAIDGKPASFLSGGEFPYPTVQGAAISGAVSITFRKYGVSIEFLPHITPRGTIRLQVTPEVSSLDFANAVIINGFNIPALATRRVSTEVELASGQSFAIAGMIDNQLTETLSRVPGLANIPLLGKLFESRSRSKTNSELLVLITPELVRSVPADQAQQIEMPKPFISSAPKNVPGGSSVAPAPPLPGAATIPVEELIENQKQLKNTPAPSAPGINTIRPQTPINPVQSGPAAANPGGSNPAQ